MNSRPRVLFPFVEAGLGHIMPMTSLADEFERLYGDRTEVVRSRFFTETGSEKLASYERHISHEVVKHNRHPLYGWFSTAAMDFFGTRLSSWGAVRVYVPGSCREGIRHMEELRPDLVVSTHWCTNYYARHVKSEPKPLTAVYVPDAHVNTLFRYPSDLTMIAVPTGYRRAREKHPHRYNDSNLAEVDFLIRKEAFTANTDKIAARRELGFDENKFTVVLIEGGYGIGKMKRICEIVLERDLPVTLVPICGKNEELYRYFLTLRSRGKTDFRPYGYTENVFSLLAAADLFCGKSGSVIMEPCFFGVPQIITKYATEIEKFIGEYYIKEVGCAEKEFDPVAVADKIAAYAADPSLLDRRRLNALSIKNRFGPTKAANLLFDLLRTRFPDLTAK